VKNSKKNTATDYYYNLMNDGEMDREFVAFGGAKKYRVLMGSCG